MRRTQEKTGGKHWHLKERRYRNIFGLALVVFLLAQAVMSLSVYAGTNVSGYIAADISRKAVDNPYIVTGDSLLCNPASITRPDNTRSISNDSAAFSGKAFTLLTIELSSQKVVRNEAIDVNGKLSALPNGGQDLSGLTIRLTVTPPVGLPLELATQTSDTMGHFSFEDVGSFTQKGTYKVVASFAPNEYLEGSASAEYKVNAVLSAGYAIIIEGKIAGDEGLESHNKTVKRIYETLKFRGFSDDNIFNFNYDTSQEGVDKPPSKADIEKAISGLDIDNLNSERFNLTEKLNSAPAPLYVIMVDHGNPDVFFIDNETITPVMLNTWLGSLETGLNTIAKQEKRVVIIGACYSGSFIPELSKTGRVIITSATEDEESYKGTNEPDGIRSGEFFLEELFKDFKKGYSIRGSFEAATEKTEIFTRQGGSADNTGYPYFDNAVQHPLLDDNGDGIASNLLTYAGDGLNADIPVGVGRTYDVNSPDNPADITDVTATKYLSDTVTSALLWAKANNDADVSAAWLEIRPPSKRLTSTGSSEQLELNIPKAPLKFNGSTNRWQKPYSLFVEPGMYEVFYYVRDAVTEDISPMQRSVVYKNKAGNTRPSAFSLQYPANGSEQRTVLLLSWGSSSDADGLTYTLLISRDSNPTPANAAYIKEGLPISMAAVGHEAGLQDLATYYWKVIAVDGYGARTSSDVRSFNTNNPNCPLPGFIQGMVTDKTTGGVVNGAVVTATSGIVKVRGSYYIVYGGSGDVTLTVSAPGYAETTVAAPIKSGESVRLNIALADNIAPETTITSKPVNPTTSKSATFSFKSSEAGSKFKCKLDGSAFTVCTSPKTYTNLPEGSHTFYVKAIDAIGNMDATPATYTWTIGP